jgi:hypothetical protein
LQERETRQTCEATQVLDGAGYPGLGEARPGREALYGGREEEDKRENRGRAKDFLQQISDRNILVLSPNA